MVLNDLMTRAGDSKQISKLFTQEAHHKYLTVIFIVQNVFYQGREKRNISLNAPYHFLYTNQRFKSQSRYFAHQIFRENSKHLPKVYDQATQNPSSYLLIHLSRYDRAFQSLQQYIPSGTNSILFASFSIEGRTNGSQNGNS